MNFNNTFQCSLFVIDYEREREREREREKEHNQNPQHFI